MGTPKSVRALRTAPPRSSSAQNVLVHEVGQGRKDPIRIAGGLRRNPLELWCDGW
jgi:hypothetical protein